MGYRITLWPSGRSFRAEAQETLLEAALRSGISIPFNCSSGSCGACKARVVAGRVDVTQPHDYPFTEAERARGYTLLCVSNAASDLSLEVATLDDAHSVPLQHITARVARLEPLGTEYLLLVLRTPRSQTLRFIAGQHVQLRMADLPPCDMAVASCPCNGMYLQFHLKRDPDNPFVRRAMEGLTASTLVEVVGPYGDFSLDEFSRRPILLVAQDSGFAPIKSLVEHAIALETGQPIMLHWYAGSGGHYLANQCRAWADVVDDFRFQLHTLERGPEAAQQAAASLVGAVDAAQYDVYLAAGSDLTAAMHTAFQAAGLPDGHLHREEKRACGVERPVSQGAGG